MASSNPSLAPRVDAVTAVALTNTAFEGMANAGRFPADLARAVYAALRTPMEEPA